MAEAPVRRVLPRNAKNGFPTLHPAGKTAVLYLFFLLRIEP
jgi:hypothetical protein